MAVSLLHLVGLYGFWDIHAMCLTFPRICVIMHAKIPIIRYI